MGEQIQKTFSYYIELENRLISFEKVFTDSANAPSRLAQSGRKHAQTIAEFGLWEGDTLYPASAIKSITVEEVG